MTAHPIDIEDLRREMEDLAGDALARDSRWAGTVSPVEALAILDLLAATEHRATRAEADLDALQAVHRDATSHARRIIAHPDRWIAQGLVNSTRHLLDALTGAVTIRGGAVQWRNHAVKAEDRADRAEARIKAVRELHQQSELIRHVPRSMREGHDDDQPFHYCTGCDGARYPCATIHALDGDA